MTIEKISGILPALITPFDLSGNVLDSSAEKLLQKYVDERADGLYMLGYTGEGSVMSISQRKHWTEQVLRVNGGRIPIIVHVGYGTPEEAIDLAAHAARHGAHSVSSVPLPGSATLQDNARYFKQVAETTELPFYIYWNQEIIDSDTGRRATASRLVETMSAFRNFAGIKYTDSNFYYLERIRHYKPELNLLTGVDTMVNAAAMLGADGAIGALQSVTCGHMKKMRAAYLAGNVQQAHELQIRANELYELLDRPDIGVIPGIKAIMTYEGIPGVPGGSTPALTDPVLLRLLLTTYQKHIDNSL